MYQYTGLRAPFVRAALLFLYTALDGKSILGLLFITKTFEQPGYFGRAVLSGIGTDRPARRRPAALDRPGTGGRVRGGLRRERAMTLMASQELLTKCLIQAN